MNKVTIISGIVDTQCLTVYTEIGEAIVIMQGDPRVPHIVKQMREGLTNAGSSIEIDLDEHRPNLPEQVEQDSALKDFSKFEKQSGLVKFFKVAKETLKKIFTDEESKPETPEPVEIVPPGSFGSTETFSLDAAMAAVENGGKDGSYALTTDVPANSIDEVMANAKAIPASSPEFHMSKEDEKTHDVVATVQMEDGSVGIVPNAHKLATQMGHATKSGNGKGVEALLKRLAAMPSKRQHSVEDLLKFLERGDLPVTDDGRIVFYKLLNEDNSKLGYADCHTGRVTQGPNTEVRMDVSLVDHNRNNECSNGLHVARRQYLHNFYGDSCFLGSLAPEDVITVPSYDANKMRVCAYQLHYLLSPEAYNAVKSNKPFDADSEAAKQLAMIVAGNQPAVTHLVTIHKREGGDVRVAEVVPPKFAQEPVEAVLADIAPVAPIEEIDPLQKEVEKPKIVMDAEKIDPTALAGDTVYTPVHVVGGGSSTIDQTKESAKLDDLMDQPTTEAERAKVHKGQLKADKPKAVKTAPARTAATPREQIAGILATYTLTADVAARVNDIKRKAKKGWHKLGVNAATEAKIKALL